METKDLLDELVRKYNRMDFIEADPISIPHQFTHEEDIAIAGFLAATIAWGNRKAILKAARQWMAWMDHAPHDFIQHATASDLEPFERFKYRTFNGVDCVFFMKSLQFIYAEKGGLRTAFEEAYAATQSMQGTIAGFRSIFLQYPHQPRSEKHIANPLTGSAAKRINMFLRWMVRKDEKGVDFGLWHGIPASALQIPLDVHSGRVAREFGLLQRKQNDWKAVEELTAKLRELDADDPVKYDFALFGAGVNGEI